MFYSKVVFAIVVGYCRTRELYVSVGVYTRGRYVCNSSTTESGTNEKTGFITIQKKKNYCCRRDDNENTDHGDTCCGLKFSRSRVRFNFPSAVPVVFCPESRFLFFFSFSSSSYYYYFGRSLLVPPSPPSSLLKRGRACTRPKRGPGKNQLEKENERKTLPH